MHHEIPYFVSLNSLRGAFAGDDAGWTARTIMGYDAMPMTPKEKQQLIASWLTLQSAHEAGTEREDLSWVVQKIWDLCDDAPNDALQFILGVLEQDITHSTLALLSAGPLEALLRKHGARIIARVERRARHDPQFARLLDHVWKDSVSASIWARVQRARDNPLRAVRDA